MVVFFLASYELVMSMVFAITSLVLAVKAMNRFVLSSPVEDFIRRKHQAGCLISGTLVFSVVYLARGSIEQSTLALQALIGANGGIGIKPVVAALAYFVIFYFISFLLSFTALYAVSIAYRRVMASIDFDEQVDAKENLGVSMFLAVTLIGIVLFIDKPMNHFLGSLVSYSYIGEHIRRN